MRINIVVRVSLAIVVLLLASMVSTAGEFTGKPSPELDTSSKSQDSNLLDSIAAEYEGPRIAVVKPIFTATAYTNAFYTFYSRYMSSTQPFITTDLEYFNVTVKDAWKWSAGLANFLDSAKATSVGLSIGENLALIDEIDVIMGALFDEDERVYDIVILGFTEYVTAEEYYYYKQFVKTGGTLIILDACNFLAEVKYHPPVWPDEVGHLSLVKGHGWEFNGTHAWKSVYHRWPEDNRNWVGSNYWRWWTGNHYDFFQANTSHPISVYIRSNYEQNVYSEYGAHEENKLENLTNTQIIGYWHFINPNEAPEDPVVAYQHMYGEGSVIHTGIMASDVIADEEFLQAFLVSAVRMGLAGEVGEWSFWEDSSYQFTTSAFYGNGAQVEQGGILSGIVTFYVDFNTSFIFQKQSYYSLEWVRLCFQRQDTLYTSEQSIINGTKIGEGSLNWQIKVNTRILVDGEYRYEISCRFASFTNASDYLDATLLDTVHEVKNISDELWIILYTTYGSIITILGIVCVYIVWNGRRLSIAG